MKLKSLVRISIRVILLALSISPIVYSCTDQTLDETNTGSEAVSTTDDSRIVRSETDLNNPFQRNVGATIDKSLGLRWVDNYIKANGRSFEYTIAAEAIRQILSQPGCNGISLRYGRDGSGKLHIIPVGVDEKGNEMRTEKVVTSDGSIDWATSTSMTNNYSGTVRSHFFGANTFDRLFQNKDCQTLHVTGALNEKNEPQLLLSDVMVSDARIVEDVSSPCPPYCAGSF